ncbi:hypothetical protein BGX31_009484 [Mortierella sp. GBA43]|nr:hypothetical protein BGX31_009484 [Mortierella sp. GBA43]
MKRKAPTPTSSAHLYVISDTETDPEDDRPELKSKRATAKGRKSTLDVIAISSDESEQDCEPPAKKTPTKAAAAEITKIESIDNNCLSQPLSRHSSIRSSAAEAIRFKPEIGIKRLWKAAHNRITKQNRWPFTHSTKRPTTETPSHASLQDDPGISDSDCEGDFDDEYDYNDDYLLGGELEIQY